MKKENFLKFLSSKWLMVTFLALGFMFLGNVDANAQSPFDAKIAHYTELRDTFAPSTAKYDTVQDAIDYLLVLESNFNSNPNYISDYADTIGGNPLDVDKIRKTHASILFEYSAAQLADFQVKLDEYSTGEDADTALAQKAQWILDVNAY